VVYAYASKAQVGTYMSSRVVFAVGVCVHQCGTTCICSSLFSVDFLRIKGARLKFEIGREHWCICDEHSAWVSKA
jgi:hypothetical protein